MCRDAPQFNLRSGTGACLLAFSLTIAGCPRDQAPGSADGTRVRLEDVRFWAYQIQGLQDDGAINALAASRYDLLVLEPTRTDRDHPDFDARGMVRRLHASPASRDGTTKLVVAYIDIGEAEDWRYYWQPDWVPPTPGQRGSPDFLIRPDPGGWSGDYPVAYWDPRWKDIIIYNADSLLQAALDDGFDGVYMDWVEAYCDEAVEQAARDAGLDPVEAMVEFIGQIRDHARRQNPDFLIIPQNAAELAGLHQGYLDLIDAIGQEDVYFAGQADTDWNDPASGDLRLPATGYYSTRACEEALQPFLQAGKVVLSVDYARDPDNAAEAYRRAAANGYIPYVSLTPLSRLTQTPPPEYPGPS
jgi:cysteinyl-tRNA synthetase